MLATVCTFITAGLAQHWQTVAAFSGASGMASGTYTTMAFLVPFEFVAPTWRLFILALPAEALGVIGFGIMAHFLPDWRVKGNVQGWAGENLVEL